MTDAAGVLAVMRDAVEPFTTGLVQAGVESAWVGLALVAIASVAWRAPAPWRFALLAVGLARFALPPLQSSLFVDLSWFPMLRELRQPLAAASLGGIATLLFAVWACGGVVQLMRLIAARIRLSRVLARADRLDAPAALLEEARVAAQQLGVAMPRVRVSSEVAAPLVAGLFRPTVIVDAGWTALDARARRLVVLHEMAHLKRGDLYWVELAAWLSVVWWWNPVFWLLVLKLRSAQEAACDDLAMLIAPDPDRYCSLLLDVARRAVGAGPSLALEPPGMGGRVLEQRIRRLMDPHTRHAAGMTKAQCVGVVVLAALVFAMFSSHAAPRATPHGMPFSHHPHGSGLHHHAHSN